MFLILRGLYTETVQPSNNSCLRLSLTRQIHSPIEVTRHSMKLLGEVVGGRMSEIWYEPLH